MRRKPTGICGSCSYLLRAKFGNNDEAYCDRFEKNLTQYAETCTGYSNFDSPSLPDMYATGWILSPGKKVGFEGNTKAEFYPPDPTQRIPKED